MDKNLRVLFQSRVDLLKYKGGDTVQIIETKKELERLGVKVDLNLKLKPKVEKYDLVHIFNLDWVCEPYIQIKNAKKQGKPVILSPIHHPLKEFERYEKEYRYGLAKLGNWLIPYQPLRDSARNLVKGIFYPKKLGPALSQMFIGIRRQQRMSVNMSDYVLVQTEKEAKDLKIAYKTNDFKWDKVINGVNKKVFENPSKKMAEKYLGDYEYILTVGRIEPRKNQLSLIKAFLELKNESEQFENVHLIFAGSKNKHHPTYVKEFNQLIEKHDFLHYPGFIEQEALSYLFKSCKVYALPTWFETTGLVYIEAAAAGATSIVASGSRAKEYLGNNAVYCDPGDINSIKRALVKALNPTVDKSFRQEILKNYTWEKTAEETLAVYKKVISSYKQ